jgi:PAS domain S-box-containing protein
VKPGGGANGLGGVLRRGLGRALRLLPGRAERHRAERSEQRLALALEAAGMAIWELDADSGAVWWSGQAAALFGGDWPHDPKVRLSHVLQLVHPEDRAAVEAAVERALAGPGASQSVQARVALAEGSLRWLEIRGQAFVDADGRLTGLRGTLLDVSELKRVEQGLRRTVAELRVVAAIADAVAAAADGEELLARSTSLLRDAFFPDHCGFLTVDPEGGSPRRAASFHSRLGADVLAGVRSVPLRAGERVLGALEVGSALPEALGADDERLLQVVASHVASALERLRAVGIARQGEELYRAYFTASPIALFVADGQGRYLEVNGAACALTGLGRDELVGRSIADILAPDAAHQGERLLGLLALGGGPSEIRIRRADGSTRHCLVHATTIGAERLLGLLLDITDRREADEKLRDSEERFRSLSEASLEAMFVHDGGKIVDVNQALCELSGYSWHELVGRDGFELIAPEYREQVYRNLLVEHDRSYEIEAVRRDGSRIPIEVQARSFPFRDRIQRVVSVRDLSARKLAAAAREALIRELEAKNGELERFGHTLTHDLKAPLVTISGFAEHLERDLGEGRGERVREDARRIGEAAARLSRMVEELLLLSRAGQPVGPPVAVAAEDLVRDALRLVGGRLQASRATVEVRAPLPVVYGDRARLVQVFQHVIDNAATFAAAAATPRVTVEARAGADGRATLVVRDNGIGIEPRHRERVFDPFQKLDERSEGDGVGLAVVRRVVESHGGRTWLEAGPGGEGTALCLTLPVPPRAERGELAGKAPATPGGARPWG